MFQIDVALFIPLCFRTFSDVHILEKLILCVIQDFGIFLNYVFKRIFACYICYIDVFQRICKFSDKFLFFFAIYNNSLLLFLDEFFNDGNIY